MISGGPGTGKTRILRAIIDAQLRSYPDTNIVCAAPTHVAKCLMPNGETLAHVLHKFQKGKARGTLFVVDECSMVGIGQLSLLAEKKLVGGQMILMGDWEGQFLPIADNYGDYTGRLQNVDLLRQMANALHIRMTEPKRFNREHFAWIMDLYPSADVGNPPSTLREQTRAQFPLGDQTDLYIVVSHNHRRRLNAFANLRDRDGVLVKCAGKLPNRLNQPQDMYLRPGMKLIGCANGEIIVNGVPYDVLRVSRHVVVVKMQVEYNTDLSLSRRTGKAAEAKALKVAKLEGEIALDHRQASRWLRLPYAVTFRNAQGITAREMHVTVMNIDHPHFDVRSLIVGASRVTHGSYLHVPTAAQERAIIENCPEVVDPDDELAQEPGEVFSDSDDE